jgi:hypothetical protein
MAIHQDHNIKLKIFNKPIFNTPAFCGSSIVPAKSLYAGQSRKQMNLLFTLIATDNF